MKKDDVCEKWMNTRFMEFVFKYAGPVSHSMRVLLELIKDEPDNIMTIVSKDDIAWALLVWFNNMRYWALLHIHDGAKKKPAAAGETGVVRSTRKKGGAQKTKKGPS